MSAVADQGYRIADGLGHAGIRVKDLVLRHRASLIWLGSVLVVSGVVAFVNLGGAPQRIDDEGTYAAQAYAIFHYGELAHYTYFYDHPPLGWIQIALYAQVTGAWARYGVAVLAAREAMIVASLISIVLIWAIVRRLGFSRPTAAVAGALFALSPLALQFHRSVYIDNIATPWLLAAILLVLEKRSQLAAFAGAAVCFGIAVLSKETYLLALPLLVWLAIRNAHPSTRRYTTAVAGSLLVLVGTGYLALAAVKGELLPRGGQVSLFNGVTFQLGARQGSGSPFDTGSQAFKVVSEWWQLDPVLITTGVLAAVIALFIRSLRPFAVLLLAATVFAFRPGGYLPVPFVVMLIPLAVLLVPTVVELAIRKRSPGIGRRLRMVAAITAGVLALAAAVPLWAVQLRGFLLADLDAPMRSAVSWVDTNVPKTDRLIVDDSMWVDLVRQGRDRQDIVWYYKADTDPAVKAQSPNGWKDADYVITTNSMRTFPDGFPIVKQAIDNSVVVAKWGSGTTEVDVRRVIPLSKQDRESAQQTVSEDARTAGQQTARNPRLSLSAPAFLDLSGGAVDPRISVALGAGLAETPMRVSAFPTQDGDTAELRRQVVIDSIGGAPAASDGEPSKKAQEFLALLDGGFAPVTTDVRGGSLVLTYPADVVNSEID